MIDHPQQSHRAAPRGQILQPVVEFVSVNRSYTEGDSVRRILTNFTASIEPGLTAVVGPSGSGKTSLLNTAGGLDEPDSGIIRVLGQRVPFGDPRALHRFRAERVSWIFQDRNLIPHMDVRGNVALPLLCAGVPRVQALDRARDAISRLGLEDHLSHRPRTLSGGERQRVAFARAAASPAPLILADEPTGSLDAATAEVALDELVRLVRELGKSILMVTHSDRAVQRADAAFELSPTGLTPIAAEAAAQAEPGPDTGLKNGRPSIREAFRAPERTRGVVR